MFSRQSVATAFGDEDTALILDGWTLGAEPACLSLVHLEPVGSGVRLTTPAEAVGVLLRRRISGPVASRGASVRLTIRIASSDARALKRALLNLSVCVVIGGRRRTLSSLHASAFEVARDGALLVSLETTWATRATASHVELRFRRAAIDCHLQSIDFTARTIGGRRGAGASGPGRRDGTRFADACVGAGGPFSLEHSPWAITFAEGEGDAPGVVLDAQGLRAEFTAASRSMTLTRRVPLPDGANGKLLRIELRLLGENADEWHGLLANIAIGVATEGRSPRNLLRLSPHCAYAESDREVRLIAVAPCLGQMTECIVELTFQHGDAVVTLEAIDVLLVARGAADPGKASPDRSLALGSPAPATASTVAPTVAVVSWQLADNAVGRAYVLADMLRSSHPTEIVGPLFGSEGVEIWEPLRSADLPMRSFTGATMRTFVAEAAAFAQEIQCDVAYISKPRLPAILLALLIHHRTGCGLILDIDDHELSFFPWAEGIGIDEAVARHERQPTGPATAATGDESDDEDQGSVVMPSLPDEERPDGGLWTALAETLIPSFDDRTVSNAALRDRYGGLVVRHARDEAIFHPDAALKARIRGEFGIDDGDRVVLFMGTPRRHKGLERLAAAMHRVDDARLRLVVIGTINDRGMQRDLLAHSRARISLFPNQPWQRLPELSHLADGVCLLQDPDSPIARYQIPAKLTDALALGVPVATTRVAPLADTPAPSVVTYIDDDDALDAWLRSIAAGDDDGALADRRIAWFHEELGYRVNRARIETVVERCLTRQRTWKPEWTALFAALNHCYGAGLPEEPPAWAGEAGSRKEIRAPAIHRRAPLDLVCFWKQNDTGIYGRRHDMLMKYLRESDRVRSLLVFDAPIRVAAVEKTVQRGRTAVLDQAKLTSDATIRRFLELDDERDVRRRVFIYGDKPGESFYGRPLDTLDGYADFVAQQIAARTACGARRLAWAWPVAPHFAEIAETIGFDEVVVDLVDDERAMTRNPDRRLVLDEEYRRTLGRADVIFANCETLRDRFPAFRDGIRVVPNACEILGDPATAMPNDIAHLPGPIIGYVGNLRHRLDVPLIEKLARLHPEWSIVLVGSAHGSPEVLRLQGLRNVHFTGPRTYEEAQRYIRGFDVAIMPHLRNDLSDSMNPLKLYVYVALGKRVVCTRVGNIEELQAYVDIADDGPEFLAKVELAVARARFDGVNRPLPREALWEISWPQRVATMLSAIA
jgi:glycosyltransferase involved in cell wall biosynthesis